MMRFSQYTGLICMHAFIVRRVKQLLCVPSSCINCYIPYLTKYHNYVQLTIVYNRGPEGNQNFNSSMLKSKNQVTLFVNYSYNSFYDFFSSENTYCEIRLCAKM